MFRGLFKWFRGKEQVTPKPVQEKRVLTKEQQLRAILRSFKIGKISEETAVTLIELWKLRKRE